MRVAIIEDENLAAQRLANLVREIDNEAEIIALLPSVEGAVQWLRNNQHPDLILCDIQLLDGTSFQIFEQVVVTRPVIFTTAYDQYAIQAFQVNSIDYLLKPVQKEKLEAAISKFRSLVRTTEVTPDYAAVLKLIKSAQGEYKSRFMVKLGQKLVAIPADKIAYFSSENKMTYIVARDGKRYPYDQTLEEIVDLLDPRTFFKVNRQYIITFESIAEMHPYFKGRLKLILSPKTNDEVVVSAERTPEFKKWIDQ